MNIPAAWFSLDAAAPRVLLLTLSLDGTKPMVTPHLAWHSSSVTCATETVHAPYSAWSTTIPFASALVGWPLVVRSLDLSTRVATIANVAITVSPVVPLAGLLKARNSGKGITARLDLYSPGMDLSSAIPLCAGRCDNISFDRVDGPVSFTLVDGEPGVSATYPPSPMTQEDYPLAPAFVLNGKRVMPVCLGPLSEDFRTIQLSSDGTVRGICSPPLTGEVRSVRRSDGVAVTGWTSSIETTSQTAQRYSVITLDAAVPDNVDVFVSGGFGVAATDPFDLLLAELDMPITDHARALLSTSPMTFSALFGASADVQSLIRDRFIKQTPFASTYRLGEFDLIDMRADYSAARPWAIGCGLLFRAAQQQSQAFTMPIYNEITVVVGRTQANSTTPTPLAKIERNPDHGPAEIRALLAQSQQVHGRRPLPQPYGAYDLYVEIQDGRPVASPSGEVLADFLAMMHATERRPQTFQAEWLRGLIAEPGEAGLLTYDDEDLSDAQSIITSIAYAATGPVITFAVPTTGEA